MKFKDISAYFMAEQEKLIGKFNLHCAIYVNIFKF